MAIHMRKGLEADLTEIRCLLLWLGKLAGEALMRALEDTDRNAAKDVIAGDDLLDGLTERIEDACMKFGARYRPLDEDLRAMISAMHTAVDLERIGDHGVNIARSALGLGGEWAVALPSDLPKMKEVLLAMLGRVLTAYEVSDAAMAEEVFALDGEVDALEKRVMQKFFAAMMECPERFARVLLLIGVARTLKRAGDHLTNIAERVVYTCSGRMPKASGYKAPRGSDV